MAEDSIPSDVDVSTPSPARMYDYYLGGKDNYVVDRDAAEQVLEHIPDLRQIATENRRFLQRAVRYVAGECGIDQFIDIGTGLPTQGNVHEIAQDANPNARVVYIDNDPIVLAHSRALLSHHAPGVATIQADMRSPEAILTHPRVGELIDFDRPVAVLFVAVLHFLTEDEDPYSIVTRFRDAMPPGSYMVLSHLEASSETQAATRVYEKATSRAEVRTREQIERFFTGFEFVEPGLVYVHDWRPEGGERTSVLGLGGVGRKP